MRFLYDPIKGLSSGARSEIRLSQDFGANPKPTADTWFGPILVKAGQYVYRVLADQDGHNGWDVAAPFREPIYAPCDGWVIEQISKPGGYGKRVSLRSEVNGQYWLQVFAHLDGFPTAESREFDWHSKGRFVSAGEVIGYVDSTGASTGHHLHWSLYPMRADGSKAIINGFGGAVDPTPYLLEKDPPMPNQTTVVLGKDGKTVWICTPCSKMEVLRERASVEGFELPAQIPPASSL